MRRLHLSVLLVFGFVTFVIFVHLGLSHASSSYSSSSRLSSLKSAIGFGQDTSPSTWYRGKQVSSLWPVSHNVSRGNDAKADSEWSLLKPDSHDYYQEESSRDAKLQPHPSLANATFVTLARNSDLWDLLGSIRSIEDRFNHKYHYPWVFLNDEPFSDEFKLHTSSMCSGPASYGTIPSSEWSDIPEWLSMDKINEGIKDMSTKPIPYGWSLPYRKMCRYQSGFFWRHPLLDPFKYYWRVEPNVKFFCDLDYDPFMTMQANDKSYGFVVTIKEYAETITTLWNTTKMFIEEHPEYLPKKNLMGWISGDNGESYNLCHFWSNFEIASLDFWRGEAYTKYFEYLDKAGGFFYERWGDAPVHSIAAALFLEPKDFHFFSDIGYRHEPFQHCPQNSVDRCACNPADSFERHWYSCTPSWKMIAHLTPFSSSGDKQ